MTGYSGALEYLYRLENFGIVLGLENIKWILDVIGNPHFNFKCVHIAGTNGKGSVASMLSHIFKEAGYIVGKYTSPHLVSFTERITVNERKITENEVTELTGQIRNNLEKKEKNRLFTFFDFTTAMAFEYFSRKKIDLAIIEVGLGGRLDSTNVIKPIVSVITNVSYDHVDYLGSKISDIAREKSGIIKEGTPVVSGVTGKPSIIIKDVARTKSSAVYELGKDFNYLKTGMQLMNYKGLKWVLDDIFIGLKGDHQLSNGAIALCAAEIIGSKAFPFKEDAARRALSGLKWPGRLEIIRKKPIIILDGAHNPNGIEAVAEFVKEYYRNERKILVFGVMKDKEYNKMLEILEPFMDIIILTKPDNRRALAPQYMKKYIKNGIVAKDIRLALQKAKDAAAKKDLILITGSLFTVGEARQVISEIF